MTKRMSARFLANEIWELTTDPRRGAATITERQIAEWQRVYHAVWGLAVATHFELVAAFAVEARDQLEDARDELLAMRGDSNRGTGGTRLHAKCGQFVDRDTHRGRCEKDEYRARQVPRHSRSTDDVWIIQRGNAEYFSPDGLTEDEAREIADRLSNGEYRPHISTWRLFAANQLNLIRTGNTAGVVVED